MVGNIDNARSIFERWMEWQPDDSAWFSYVKFEMRQHNVALARTIYERYVHCHPYQRAFVKFANWEEKNNKELGLARAIYERAMAELRDDEKDEDLYISFAGFEERCHEFARSRAIYNYALDTVQTMTKEAKKKLYSAFISFEKKHGDRANVEDVVVTKRRIVYEKSIQENELDYDKWFQYIMLEENEFKSNNSAENGERAREVCERAIAQLPPIEEKKYWRRYIYLWIKYAIFEELQMHDIDKARSVYKKALEVIPHKNFTFAKIWILYANFEIRQRQLEVARKTLGQALGMCPKSKLFTSYIHLEFQLGEIDRCRKLYEKFLTFEPHNCLAWSKYADLEKQSRESDTEKGNRGTERARAIYELAISQPMLDMPEVLWKKYIDFETENKELEKTQVLYERLLEKTKHVKVWISFANFEGNYDTPTAGREVFTRAYQFFKEGSKNEERLVVLEAWMEFETQLNPPDLDQQEKVRKKMPKKLQKVRMTYDEDGQELGNEEYEELVFPDDEKPASSLKLLQAAHLWKKRKLTQA